VKEKDTVTQSDLPIRGKKTKLFERRGKIGVLIRSIARWSGREKKKDAAATQLCLIDSEGGKIEFRKKRRMKARHHNPRVGYLPAKGKGRYQHRLGERKRGHIGKATEKVLLFPTSPPQGKGKRGGKKKQQRAASEKRKKDKSH